MSKRIPITLAIGLLLPQVVPAQSTLYLSTLGQASGVNTVVGSDSWRAVGFVSGTNQAGYQLDSVQLLMGPATAGASGFRAMLYTATGVMPGNNLGSLIGSDPFSTGLYGFAASNIALTPSTQYFVVLTAETSLADGTYAWSIQSGFHNNASDGWRLSGDYLASTGGSDWAGYRPNPFQFAISASPIPEPAAAAVIGSGLACLLLRGRKPRQQAEPSSGGRKAAFGRSLEA